MKVARVVVVEQLNSARLALSFHPIFLAKVFIILSELSIAILNYS